MIGIDPHKRSHTAAVLDDHEQVVGELRVVAGGDQRDRLLAFAEPFTPRAWAIEAATGLGSLLAQQLVAAHGQSVGSSHDSARAALELGGLAGAELPTLAAAEGVDPKGLVLVRPPS